MALQWWTPSPLHIPAPSPFLFLFFFTYFLTPSLSLFSSLPFSLSSGISNRVIHAVPRLYLDIIRWVSLWHEALVRFSYHAPACLRTQPPTRWECVSGSHGVTRGDTQPWMMQHFLSGLAPVIGRRAIGSVVRRRERKIASVQMHSNKI